MSRIHPSALIEPGAQLDSSVQVGAFSVIGPHVQIDAGTVIGVFFPERGGRGLPPPGLTSSLSAEEIERRRSVRTGRTLDEILRSVESR